MTSLEDLLTTKEYKHFAKFAKKITHNSEAILDEIEKIHSKRKSRKIGKKGRISNEDISDASLEDTTYRSRLAEILIVSKRQTLPIQTAMDAVMTSMRMHISPMKLPGGSTKTEKDAMIRTLPAIASVYLILKTFSLIQENVGYILEDIKQVSFKLNERIKIIEANRGKSGTNYTS